MKILHILDTSVPRPSGYSTRSYYLVTNQKKQKETPVVLTSERFGKVEQIEGNIDDVHYYRTIPQENILARKFPIIAQIDEINFFKKRILAVIKKEKPDIIHAHSPSFIGSAALKAAKKNNLPLVYEIRAFWEDAAVDQGKITEKSLMYKLIRQHETRVVRKADAVIVICEGLKNDLIHRGIDSAKIYKVMNGVDAEKFQPLQSDIKLKTELGLKDKTVIGFIGSFFEFEGLHLLIEAMTQTLLKDNNIVLLLVGGGPIENKLHDLAEHLKLTDHVIFTGRVPHQDVMNYYSIIDLFVYPRISMRITELVTALKPLEAMAMGKAVLMSDVGGMKELADAPGVAEFFKAGDPVDLSNKVIELCENSNRRKLLGNKARENVLETWGWSSRAKKDIEIYKLLI